MVHCRPEVYVFLSAEPCRVNCSMYRHKSDRQGVSFAEDADKYGHLIAEVVNTLIYQARQTPSCIQ